MNEQSLVTRVNRLERENRRMKLMGVLVLLGITAVMVMGQASSSNPTILRAEQFILQDKNGNARGAFLSHPDGSPGLIMTDSQNKLRIGVMVKPNGEPSLNLYGEKNQFMVLTPFEFGLYDDEDNPRVLIAENPTRQMTLNLYSKNGQRSVLASSGLVFQDRKEITRYEALTLPNGGTRIKLVSEKNQTMELLPDTITFKTGDKTRAGKSFP